MKRRPAFESLSEAVAWLRDVWSARDVPARLHEDSFEGEGLFFAPAFARYLSAQPGDKIHDHPRDDVNDDVCPYRYPMWRAIDMIQRRSERTYELIITLVINAFNVADTCEVLNCREDQLLAAIRSLHSVYVVAPKPKRSWLDKSESQRNAETLSLMVMPALS